ncbi:MAG TPA: hypothetical protein DCE25_04535 [Pseudomonas sp.]|nr:hypothetical protein [Pseudomonas sp.]
MDTTIKAQFARSFSGRLYVRINGWEAPLRPSKMRIHDAATSLVAKVKNGWLMAGGSDDSAALDFSFDSMTEDRLHFHISLYGTPERQKLGISRNGFLGFYQVADVTDYWKIEPLQLTAQGLLCNLRDHQGQRVALTADTQACDSAVVPRNADQKPAYLNVSQGESYEFVLKLNE